MNQPRHIKLEGGHTGAVRFLSGLHVNLEEGKTTSWVTVTRTGDFSDPRYGKFSITNAMLLSMVANFNAGVYGQDVFIDIAHDPSGGAAGKILKLSVENDRLRAQVEWTPMGIEAIKQKGYRYLSAEYHENWQDNEDRKKHGPVLLGAGLVIRPCIKKLDPIQLSEGSSGDVPTLLHPTLLSELTQETQIMWKQLLEALKAKLMSFKLAEAAVAKVLSAAEEALKPITEEAQAKVLMASFEDIGKQLSEGKSDNFTITLSSPSGLSESDIERILTERRNKEDKDARELQEKLDANKKLLSDTIAANKDFDAETVKVLSDEVADLITATMTAEQIKKLAENQIKHGNEVAAARKLAGLGFQFAGSARISVDSSNQVKALQEAADRRLGFADMPASRRYSNTEGQLQTVNKQLAEQVLAQFDAANGPRLHAEHRMLSGGDGLVSDVAVPATFERTVIREVLYNLVGLQFVDVGTAAFSATTQIPYSYRDTAAAGTGNTRVYEGQPIRRAGIKQAMDTAYAIPQKLAFEVSDEMRYLTSNGQFAGWDALAENARNAVRIIGEDTEQLIFNEQLNAADQYLSLAVSNEAVGTGNGTYTTFPLNNFPVVRPKKVYDLQGAQVGSTLYPHTVTINAVSINEYDFTGTQGAGTYYWIDYNLGEIHVVNQAGAPVAVTNSHAVVCSYTYATNVVKFDTDLGSLDNGAKWDDFLTKFGLRKSILEDQRAHRAGFGLMSGTVHTQVEQADSFVESGKRDGTNLDSMGNLGVIKGVPQYKPYAPGLAMGDQRVVIGEKGLTRFRMAKAWSMSELENQKDASGRFIGKKEAYGDQFIFLHTPTPLKMGLTSMALYSSSVRIDRA